MNTGRKTRKFWEARTYPERLRRLQEESGLPWAEIARRLDALRCRRQRSLQPPSCLNHTIAGSVSSTFHAIYHVVGACYSKRPTSWDRAYPWSIPTNWVECSPILYQNEK